MTFRSEVGLRSNRPVDNSMWATRPAQWRALGLTDEEMGRPKIAIVNTSSQLATCFSHLDAIVPCLKAAQPAGGPALEVRTAAPSDFITVGHGGRYILPSRDLIASYTEVAVEGALLDGTVCLASSDKTTPGQLMGAARLDIPTIVVACGYDVQRVPQNVRDRVMESESYSGRHGINLFNTCTPYQRASAGPGWNPSRSSTSTRCLAPARTRKAARAPQPQC